MRPSEFQKRVAAKADTPGLQINAAVTNRVLSVAFMDLARQSPTECAETIANMLRTAEAKLQDEAVSDGSEG